MRRRIEGYWRPYHDALRLALDGLYERFDAVWHLNCHSMPSATRGPRRLGATLQWFEQEAHALDGA